MSFVSVFENNRVQFKTPIRIAGLVISTLILIFFAFYIYFTYKYGWEQRDFLLFPLGILSLYYLFKFFLFWFYYSIEFDKSSNRVIFHQFFNSVEVKNGDIAEWYIVRRRAPARGGHVQDYYRHFFFECNYKNGKNFFYPINPVMGNFDLAHIDSNSIQKIVINFKEIFENKYGGEKKLMVSNLVECLINIFSIQSSSKTFTGPKKVQERYFV